MPSSLSVAQYLSRVNNLLSQNITDDIPVEGEISDYHVSHDKWVNFDLKDETEEAVIKCFATVWQLRLPLENGMRVRVCGYPKIYERYGSFKLVVQTVELVGAGALRRDYELLKKRLETEGLFDARRKRPLPRFPRRIGLITSREAAAYGDFLRVLNNRWSGVDVRFVNVQVQGREAVDNMVGALQLLNNLDEANRPDVLVLIRGGGGLDDLHAFNNEQVARAVFQSSIPVVCGVGHERDESLCDFVADVRASTPSNAAERVVPNRREVLYELTAMRRRVDEQLHDCLSGQTLRIERATRAMGAVVYRQHQRLAAVITIFDASFRTWFNRQVERLRGHRRVLEQLDPQRVLSRGYSIVTLAGQVLKDVAALDFGRSVRVQLAHGSFGASVTIVNKEARLRAVRDRAADVPSEARPRTAKARLRK